MCKTMKWPTFLIWAFLGVLVSCDSTEDNANQPQDGSCTNLPPNLMKMTRGVDLASLDLFPSNPDTDQGFKSTIIEFTCKKNRKWIHPFTNVSYDQPDQIEEDPSRYSTKIKERKNNIDVQIDQVKKHIANPYKENFCKRYPDNTEYNNLYRAKQQFWHLVNGANDLNVPLGAFSVSVTYKQIRRILFKGGMLPSKVVFETSCDLPLSFFALKKLAHLKLSQAFKKAIASLKEPFEKHQPAYDKFFNQFGTYYFSWGTFGKGLHIQKKIDKKYFSELLSRFKTNPVDIGPAELMTLFKNVSTKRTKQEEMNLHRELEENSVSHTRYYGGDLTLADESSADKWVSEAENKNPWLIEGEIKPIYQLIRDETIQSEVQAALLWRQIKLEMKELEENMKFLGKPLKEENMLGLYAARAFNLRPGLQLAKLTEQAKRIKAIRNEIWERGPKH